ncbi:MAG: hypothetical protein Unbinned5081contig1002_42 [Prokaryotic dsDNA virus sp.]|nr:MAG: hypothetical protein Unbinned5081contig1002_42 [Prokaryotic dsDNA virus sp.]|tara:strand:+ start:26953 stop:27720 length:768 start_codon:yes stop_codon:yes gene_type:complete
MTWYPALSVSSNVAFNPASQSAIDGGGFTPNTISDIMLWLDASDRRTIKESSGSVNQWNDKSGNNYNATQGTGSLQPTTDASTQNGLNVLDFDGTEAMDLPSGTYTLPQGDNTIFIVSARASEDATSDTVLGMGIDATSNKYFIIYSPTAGSIDFRSNDAGSSSITNTGNTNTNFQVIRGRRSGTTQAIAVNGGAEDTNASGSDATGIDVARVGQAASGVLRLTGSIAEIIAYGRSLSAAEIASVENYLMNKWAI